MPRRDPEFFTWPGVPLSGEAVGKFGDDRFVRCAVEYPARWRRCGGAPACRRAGGSLGREGGDPVAVELEEVVAGGDEPPFRPAGRSPAALEAADLAAVLQLTEDRLDRGLAPAV